MSSWRVELACPADDAEIRRLLRENPMDGAVQLSLEQEPSTALAGSILGDLHQIVVARDVGTGRLLAMGARSVLTAWLNGRRQPVGYLGELRVDPRHRNRIRLIRDGYRLLRALHADGRTRLYVTTIVEDNRAARRLLEAGLPGLPRYRRLGAFVTVVLPVRRGARHAPDREAGGDGATRIEPAGPRDLPAIVACLDRHGERRQLCPAWTEEDFESAERTRGLSAGDFLVARRHDRVVACLARWDQRAFRQAVVRGYGRGVGLMRPLFNLAAPWTGQLRLPSVGEPLACAFLSHLAVDGDDTLVFAALLARARRDAARRGDLDGLVLGLSRTSPLLPALTALPHRRYTSIVYLVHWEEDDAVASALDDRVPHLEAAIL